MLSSPKRTFPVCNLCWIRNSWPTRPCKDKLHRPLRRGELSSPPAPRSCTRSAPDSGGQHAEEQICLQPAGAITQCRKLTLKLRRAPLGKMRPNGKNRHRRVMSASSTPRIKVFINRPEELKQRVPCEVTGLNVADALSHAGAEATSGAKTPDRRAHQAGQ